MNREDIIRMAREAGFADGIAEFIGLSAFERFAALVASAERNRTWTQDHWTEYERAIVAQEREACAKLCESEGIRIDASYLSCAQAIRARGQA